MKQIFLKGKIIMKKIVSLLTAGSMLASMAVPALAHWDASKAANVPYVSAGTIELDGQMNEAAWADAAKIEIRIFCSSMPVRDTKASVDASPSSSKSS